MVSKFSKVLVTGSSGFLGSNLVDFLKKEGHRVVLFDRVESKFKSEKDIEIIGDINNPDHISEALKGCKAVFHYAALSDIDNSKHNPKKTFEINVMGTLNLLNEMKKKKIKRFIFASSIYVYSDKGSFYKSSKVACESIIDEYKNIFDLQPTILRFGSLYGPRAPKSNLITKFLIEAINKNQISFNTDGNELRDYIHVYDASKLSVKSLSKKFINKELIISGKTKAKIKEIALMISEIMDNKINIRFKKNINRENHYTLTPFKYRPSFAEKYMLNMDVDMGQGLLELIYELEKKKNL